MTLSYIAYTTTYEFLITQRTFSIVQEILIYTITPLCLVIKNKLIISIAFRALKTIKRALSAAWNGWWAQRAFALGEEITRLAGKALGAGWGAGGTVRDKGWAVNTWSVGQEVVIDALTLLSVIIQLKMSLPITLTTLLSILSTHLTPYNLFPTLLTPPI